MDVPRRSQDDPTDGRTGLFSGSKVIVILRLPSRAGLGGDTSRVLPSSPVSCVDHDPGQSSERRVEAPGELRLVVFQPLFE